MNKLYNNILLWVLVAYSILLAIFLPAFIYKIDPDLIAYISISKQLFAGNFYDAINAYWSPLLSWLMVPFILSGIDGVIAHKIITCAAGFSILISLFRLVQQHIQTPLFRIVFFVWILPLLLFFSLIYPTPDILSVAILLIVWNNLEKLLDNPALKYCLIVGLMLTLGYLCKYYIFYAGILFISIAIIYAILIKKTGTIKYLFYTSVIFLSTSFIWILCLQNKFNTFSPTSSSSYNMSILNPTGVRHPMQVGDSLLPINYEKYSVTSWESPLDYPLEQWSPFSSFEDFKTHIQTNITANFIHLKNKNIIELLLLITTIVYLIIQRKKYPAAIWFMLACTLLFPIGYFWMLTLNRYVIFSLFLSVLIVSVVWEKIYAKYPIIMIALIISIGWSHKNTFKAILHPFDTGNEYLSYYENAMTKTDLTSSKIMASPLHWREGLYISYYATAKFYDTLKPDNLNKELPKLKATGIRYYICGVEEVPADYTSDVVYSDKWAIIDLSLH